MRLPEPTAKEPSRKRPGWIRIVKWILVLLIAVRLMQVFVSWLTGAG